jgi:hypothetical protein
MIQSSTFLISTNEKLSHCDTESDFQRRDGWKKSASMISIPVFYRAESATDDILLTIIFWTAEAEKWFETEIFPCWAEKKRGHPCTEKRRFSRIC